VCFPLDDAKRLYEIVEKYEIQNREIDLLKKQLELAERESALKDKAIELEKERSKLFEDAFNKEKEITGKALELAEKSQSGNTVWKVVGALGVVAIIVTVIAVAF
jgi:hypothetical protein